jgi:4-oxalomesaconate tautomerase
LLPTGNVRDRFDGVDVTCIDNGMPVVVMAATDLDCTGYETPAELEANAALKQRVESIRLQAGRAMKLGDVTNKTVPKMCLVAPPQAGGAICTRNFIPKRVHKAIGVLGAVSVATACGMRGSVAAAMARPNGEVFDVEHPTGFFTVELSVTGSGAETIVNRAALLRTARKLMSGMVFVP